MSREKVRDVSAPEVRVNEVNGPPPSPDQPPPDLVRARPIQYSNAGRPAAVSPLALPTLSLRTAVLDLAFVLVAAAVALGLPGLVLGAWTAATGQQGPREITFGALMIQELFQATVACVVVAYLLRRRNLPPTAFGLQTHDPERQVLWGAAGLGLTYGWMVVTVLVIGAVLLLHPDFQSDLMKRQELMELLPHTFWRVILLMIPVAVSEEIFFRGLMLPYLRRITGHWWPAVLISTVIFASLHFQQGVIGILQISGVAAIFALVFIYSRSLLATIVAHFGFNVGQVIFVRLAEDMLRSQGF